MSVWRRRCECWSSRSSCQLPLGPWQVTTDDWQLFYTRRLRARKLDRSFSELISTATAPYKSSTEEQRSAARFTTTLAMGPIKTASSLLTESSSTGSNLFVPGPPEPDLVLPTGEPIGVFAGSDGDPPYPGWIASVCSVAASSSEM